MLALAALRMEATAHAVHTGSGEAHFNAVTRKLEVSLAVFADDLETSLSARAERALSLEKTSSKEFDAQLLAYLKSTFRVTSQTGAVQPLIWVGRGFEPAPTPSPETAPAPAPGVPAPIPGTKPAPPDETLMMLYFEVALPEGLEGISIQYHLLTETFPDQKNILLIHDGPRRTSLAFTASSLAKPVIFPRP